MKLLVITSSYPRDEHDISGAFVREWARALVAQGHTLTILAWGDTQPRAMQHEPGITVHWVRYALDPRGQTLFYGDGAIDGLEASPLRALMVPQAVMAMAITACGTIARARPDLIIGHWLVPGGWIARAIGRMCNVPSVVIAHSGGVHVVSSIIRRAGPVGRALGGALARTLWRDAHRPSAKTISFVQREQQSMFARWVDDPSPGVILPMGFEPPQGMRVGREANTIPAGDPTQWLSMGRLVPIKRVDHVMRAFWSADLLPSSTLHIAGDGPLRPSLEALASELAAQAPTQDGRAIVFHGVVRGGHKAELLERCGVAVFGSQILDSGRSEGLPVSLLEASGHGCVPLVAELPGVSSLLVVPSLQRLGSAPKLWANQFAAFVRAYEQVWVEQTYDAANLLSWPFLGPRWSSFLRDAR